MEKGISLESARVKMGDPFSDIMGFFLSDDGRGDSFGESYGRLVVIVDVERGLRATFTDDRCYVMSLDLFLLIF